MKAIKNSKQLQQFTKVNSLVNEFYLTENVLEESKTIYKASEMEKEVFNKFVDEIGFNFFSDGLWNRVTIGKNADRLMPYLKKGVLLETYHSETDDFFQFGLCKYLALSTDEELLEMESLGILVPGVCYTDVIDFLKSKDAKKKATAA
ncbi:hypothetical protein MCEKH37_01653 [Methylophilaceae bacterium]